MPVSEEIDRISTLQAVCAVDGYLMIGFCTLESGHYMELDMELVFGCKACRDELT